MAKAIAFEGTLTKKVVVCDKVVAKKGAEVYGFKTARGEYLILNLKLKTSFVAVPKSFLQISDTQAINLQKSDPAYDYIIPDEYGVTLPFRPEN